MGPLEPDLAAVLAGDRRWAVKHGNSLFALRQFPDASIDSLVTDPPGGIAFMGREWDGDLGGRDQWITWLASILTEAYRVLKPGAHILVWSIPRTSHWTGMAVENAGFRVVDTISHLFASGFPKSRNVARDIDRKRVDDIRPVCRYLRAAMVAAGASSAMIAAWFNVHSRMVDHWAARDTDSQPTVPTLGQWRELKALLGFGDEMDAEVERLNARKGTHGEAYQNAEIIGEQSGQMFGFSGERFSFADTTIRAPSETAAEWAGFGSALKPAHEDWWLARKPCRGTIASNVLEYGTGALNIDATRVAHASAADFEAHEAQVNAIKARGGTMAGSWKNSSDLSGASDVSAAGRWPANLMITHADGCRCVGSREAKANPTWATPARECESTFTGEQVSEVRHEGEVVPVFECVEGCPARELDRQSGGGHANGKTLRTNSTDFSGATRERPQRSVPNDSGGSSRYFHQFQRDALDEWPFVYMPKPGTGEKERGLDDFAPNDKGRKNEHPTPKGHKHMGILCRLVTPPGGIVVDLFCGSGSTGIGALLNGFRFIGIDLNDTPEEPFVSIARARLTHVAGGGYKPTETAIARRVEPVQRSLFGSEK